MFLQVFRLVRACSFGCMHGDSSPAMPSLALIGLDPDMRALTTDRQTDRARALSLERERAHTHSLSLFIDQRRYLVSGAAASVALIGARHTRGGSLPLPRVPRPLHPRCGAGVLRTCERASRCRRGVGARARAWFPWGWGARVAPWCKGHRQQPSGSKAATLLETALAVGA